MPPPNLPAAMAAIANALAILADVAPALDPLIANALTAKDTIIAQKDREIDERDLANSELNVMFAKSGKEVKTLEEENADLKEKNSKAQQRLTKHCSTAMWEKSRTSVMNQFEVWMVCTDHSVVTSMIEGRTAVLTLTPAGAGRATR